MCVNCVSTAEAIAVEAVFVGYAVKLPLQRALARAGLCDEPDLVARDVRTIAFLRGLELDPVEILGADVVADAAAWVPAGAGQRTPVRSRWRARLAASARPIGSHSLLTTQ
ncbi:MAG: hypothetical protein ABW122_12245 [Ilumatobacteraceae bacterium]